ncbi:GDSL-type esterase/lipase family protein [Brevibacterium album]|uniref:GDSL-type esterase/lipase family protein n=1 Tax=Brevibacterium album TaxID=417948 RepID=UPI000684790D|nr:GDSL-type esterase/lipase family protein [Brevibacterium album]
MSASSHGSHRVFSFGTLLDEKVQQHLFSRTVVPSPDSLSGYELTEVVIEDAAVIAASGLDVHRGLTRRLGGAVDGGVLELTDAELARADAYEVSDYTRRRVQTSRGGAAWAYVDARPLASAERIAVVGDSLASGLTDPNTGWFSLLAGAHIRRDETHHRFFDLTVPGATIGNVVDSQLADAFRRSPDTVIVTTGFNGLSWSAASTPTSVTETISLVNQVADTIESSGARPVVIGPHWHDEQRVRAELGIDLPSSSVIGIDRELMAWSTRTYRDYICVRDVLRDRSDLLSVGLHPTAEGHALLARRLFTTIAADVPVA